MAQPNDLAANRRMKPCYMCSQKNGEYLYVHGNGRNEELWDGDGWENYENINTGLFARILGLIF